MLTFRDFMETSLYHPQQGYYYGRIQGRDFYTAPQLHPAFGEILAEEIALRLDRLDSQDKKSPLFIVEMGSGDGTLSRQILRALKNSRPKWLCRIRYALVERVEPLLLDSMLSIQDMAGRLLGYTRLEDLPRLRGVLFSNELLDSMPVYLLEKKSGCIQEVYVDMAAAPVLSLGAFSCNTLAETAAAIAPYLEEGERHAVNLEAPEWLSAVSRILEAGSVITVDYGRPDILPNSPRGFYQHTVTDRLLDKPFRQDLTASVDFASLQSEGERLGLKTVYFSSLTRFLIERGILERLPPGDSAEAFEERNRLKTLFHPQGMGEAFQVLIQEKCA